jgi:hypothetical protein
VPYVDKVKSVKKHGGFPTEVSDMEEREPWDFYEWIACNEKPRCPPNIFPIMFWRKI